MSTMLRRSIPFAALVMIAATPSTPVVDGWTFTWKVTAEGSNGEKVERGGPPNMKVSLIPGKARIDYVDAAPPGQKRGSYVIIDADKGDFIMVSPEDKTALIMDPTALSGALNAVSKTKLLKFEITDVKVSVEKVGPGEQILGRSTTKYLVTRDYKMDVAVLMKHNRSTHHGTTEYWIASDKMMEDRAFEAWAKNFTSSVGGIGGEGGKKLIDAEQSQLPKGVMLKMVTTSTDTEEKGKVTTSKMTMEMQELSKASLDASLFRIPDGYQVTDMKAQMAAISDSMKVAKAQCEKEKGKGNCEMIDVDSAMKAGAKEGAKDGAAEAAKKKLRGLFKKP